MRQVVLLFFFSVTASTLLAQESPQLRFDEANTLLESSMYIQALRSYKDIEADGFYSGPLYLNMGIASVQIDSLGLAKYYFAKASSFPLVEKSAETALEFVNSQFSRQSATLPKLPWDKLVDTLKTSPGAYGLFIIGYIFVLISILLIASKWFDIFSLPKQKEILIGCLSLSALLISLAYYVDYVDARYDEAVLVVKELPVSENPQENSTLISMAYEGYEVTVDHRITSDNDDWYYIRLGNGQYGWIKSKGIKIL